MSDKFFSRRNMDFTLFEVLNVTELTQYPYFNAHDRDTFGMVMDTTTDIAEKIMRPAYVDSDRNPPELVNGQVKSHAGVHQFVKAFREAGLLAAPFSMEWEALARPLFPLLNFIVTPKAVPAICWWCSSGWSLAPFPSVARSSNAPTPES